MREDLFAAAKAVHQRMHRPRIGIKFGEVVAEILILRVSEHLQLGIVRPKYRSVLRYAVQRNRRGLEKPAELSSLAADLRLAFVKRFLMHA